MQTPRHTRLAGLGLALLFGLSACDKGDGEASKDAASKDAASKDADGSGAAASGELPTTEAQVKTFLKEQNKKGCEMLSPALVAQVLEVPEGELKQMKIGGCMYNWTSADGSQSAEASITTIFVHKDVDRAQRWFESTTKDVTAEEIAAQLGSVMDKTKEHESIDTKAKEQAVDQVGGFVGAMVPPEGYKYEDVPGVGDAARVRTHDGNVIVRLGNMVFTVGGYKGPAAPQLDLTSVKMTDTQAILALSKEHEAKWLAQTRDVRRERAGALAKAIVAGL